MVLEAVIAAVPAWYTAVYPYLYLVFYGMDIVGAFGVGVLAWVNVLLGVL
jgi:hypothetical protein